MLHRPARDPILSSSCATQTAPLLQTNTYVQWHPEKPPFEFGMTEIPHTLDAILVSQHLVRNKHAAVAAGNAGSLNGRLNVRRDVCAHRQGAEQVCAAAAAAAAATALACHPAPTRPSASHALCYPRRPTSLWRMPASPPTAQSLLSRCASMHLPDICISPANAHSQTSQLATTVFVLWSTPDPCRSCRT